MSATSISGTVTQTDTTQKNITLRGSIAFAAGDYAAGGVVLDFTSLTFPPGQNLNVTKAPIDVTIKSQPAVADAVDGLWQYQYLVGSDPTDGQVQIFGGAAAQSPLDEFDDGALAASITSDTIIFTAVFQRE